MVGPTLDQTVPCPHQRLVHVQDGPDLTRQDDGVVHRPRPMHRRMADAPAIVRIARANRIERPALVELSCNLRIRWEFDHTEDGSLRWRLQHDLPSCRVVETRVVGWRFVRHPEVRQAESGRLQYREGVR